MFESVTQGGRFGGMVYVTSLLVSLMAHAVIICLLVVVPLVFFNVLKAEEFVTFLYEPPAPPVQPPPPPPPARSASSLQQRPINLEYSTPSVIPKGIPPAEDFDVEPLDPRAVITGIPGVVSGQPGGAVKGIEGILTAEAKPLAPPPPPEKKRDPVRVGILQQSKLIYKVNPVYPPLALKARVQGTVILEAIIDEEGSVSSVKVLGGHVLLVDAAVQAVKQWKYSPTVLSGEPVPVVATVTVIFHLD